MYSYIIYFFVYVSLLTNKDIREHEMRSYKNDREHAIAEHLIVNIKIVTIFVNKKVFYFYKGF